MPPAFEPRHFSLRNRHPSSHFINWILIWAPPHTATVYVCAFASVFFRLHGLISVCIWNWRLIEFRVKPGKRREKERERESERKGERVRVKLKGETLIDFIHSLTDARRCRPRPPANSHSLSLFGCTLTSVLFPAPCHPLLSPFMHPHYYSLLFLFFF